MKHILSVVVAILLSKVALSSQSKGLVPATEKSRFVYLEFHPNSDKVITIQSIKCESKTNDLRIQKFQTESNVTNGTVNVINIYARSGNCKRSPYSSVWQEKINIPKNDKNTHVYITILSDNIMVL